MKRNDSIINDPCLHPLALYLGYKSEKASHLVEDILLLRALKFGAIEKGFYDNGVVCMNA